MKIIIKSVFETIIPTACYRSFSSVSRDKLKLGFIGLGRMGYGMTKNLCDDGHQLVVYDKKISSNVMQLKDRINIADSIEQVRNCPIVFSMLPNDNILNEVADKLLRSDDKPFTHISCSTISPKTSRYWAKEYEKNNMTFIAAPVFARPDGIIARKASWLISGEEKGRKTASSLLQSSGNVFQFGDDVGAANVVKIVGNFLIASSIEAIGEGLTLAEKYGVNRVDVMTMLSSTIFDCLIYKGYGDRVSKRDHSPGGFALELGLKDVRLAGEAAREVNASMPFLSALENRFASSHARGRSAMDWSAIGLSIAEDAGINVEPDIKRILESIRMTKDE